MLRLLEFADRNRIPYRWLDPDNPDDRRAIAACGSSDAAGSRVVLGGQPTLERPTPLDLARAIGLDLSYRQDAPSDLIVVGAGPGGLAAAVYGASEDLSTLVVEDTAIGGQAGTSSCIENYVGLAIKFGSRVPVPRRATALQKRENVYGVQLDDGGVLLGRSVVIATGARYRRLSLSGQEAFEGAGIYYAATRSKQSAAGARRSLWSVAGTPPGRRPCSFRSAPVVFTSFAGDPTWRGACRNICLLG